MKSNIIQPLNDIRFYIKNINNFYNVKRVSKFKYVEDDYYIYTIDFAVYLTNMYSPYDVDTIKHEVIDFVDKYNAQNSEIKIDIVESSVFKSSYETGRINYRIQLYSIKEEDIKFREDLKEERDKIYDMIIGNNVLLNKIISIKKTEVRILGFSSTANRRKSQVVVSGIEDGNTYSIEPHIIYNILYRNKDTSLDNIINNL